MNLLPFSFAKKWIFIHWVWASNCSTRKKTSLWDNQWDSMCEQRRDRLSEWIPATNIFIHMWSVLSCPKQTRMHAQTLQSYIPPIITAGLALHLAPQGHRVWPQTSYWLLTVVKWSVHIPTLTHYVQKTQQRKIVVRECLEVCKRPRVSTVSLLNPSHLLDGTASYPGKTGTANCSLFLACEECFGLVARG